MAMHKNDTEFETVAEAMESQQDEWCNLSQTKCSVEKCTDALFREVDHWLTCFVTGDFNVYVEGTVHLSVTEASRFAFCMRAEDERGAMLGKLEERMSVDREMATERVLAAFNTIYSSLVVRYSNLE